MAAPSAVGVGRDTSQRGRSGTGHPDSEKITVDSSVAVEESGPFEGADRLSRRREHSGEEPVGGSGEQPGLGQPELPTELGLTYDSGPDTRFSTASQFEVPEAGNLTDKGGTVSLWVQPEWTEGSQDDTDLVQLGENTLHIFNNVNFVRFEFIDNSGTAQGTGTSIGEWQGGDWHNITATWDGGTISFCRWAAGRRKVRRSAPTATGKQALDWLQFRGQPARGTRSPRQCPGI
jgi:hypothetical protein